MFLFCEKIFTFACKIQYFKTLKACHIEENGISKYDVHRYRRGINKTQQCNMNTSKSHMH